LSDNSHIEGQKPQIRTPTLFIGKGKIRFKNNVNLGYFPSPYYYDGQIYIESRNKDSLIEFGSNVMINNNFRIICDKSRISIGDSVLIGTNVEILDSDFHEVDPNNRNSGNYICKPVYIKDNVFIGNNVTILKGVSIGTNSIVANGSLVLNSFPDNVIIGGVPAKIIGNL
jgi:maltose O-acetyltransferase